MHKLPADNPSIIDKGGVLWCRACERSVSPRRVLFERLPCEPGKCTDPLCANCAWRSVRVSQERVYYYAV